ncbi:alpha/beta fold hydrolase [Sphingomonas sp. RS2018]
MLRSETAASAERRERAMGGLRRYQAADRVARPPFPPAVATSGRVRLIDYGGDGAKAAPVVVVPSLINPPFVLDLTPDTSLLRWLATQGRRVLLVDWGQPHPGDRDEDLGMHVEHLRALIATLSEPPVLIGYCLGGTIAVAAAAKCPVAALGLIATPWRFSGFGDTARQTIADLWESARPACEALGVVPMEVLQAGFWQLDPARTIAKYEALADADTAQLAAFVALEDWANAGAPITLAAGREMFEGLFAGDLPGSGRWLVGGKPVDPSQLTCPIADFVSDRDRIVPAATSIGLGERHDVAAGHVGMIVGGRAPALLWQPLMDWIDRAAPPR